MLKTISTLIVLLMVYGCSSTNKRVSISSLDDYTTISRKDFLNIVGPILFKGRIYLGEGQLESDISYWNAGLCKQVFEKSPHQLSLYINRAEVAACMTPFISTQSRRNQSFRYKDLPVSSPYYGPISIFLQEGLIVPDSEYLLGINRPVSGVELKQILSKVKKSKI